MKSYRIIHKSAGDNGILRWVSRASKIADISGKGLINLSSDSTRADSGPLSVLIGYDPTNNGWWGSNGAIGTHYILIDFLSFDVFVDGYSTSCGSIDVQRDLSVYGSNNYVDWQLIDRRTYEKEPSTGVLYYACQNPMKARYVAFVANSTRFRGDCSFALNSLDLYGTIQWFGKCSCNVKRENYFLMKLSYLILMTT